MQLEIKDHNEYSIVLYVVCFVCVLWIGPRVCFLFELFSGSFGKFLALASTWPARRQGGMGGVAE